MTTNSKLSPHVIAEHMDFDGLDRWRPPVIKIVDFDNERCRRAYECNPAALFVLRDWALSEQHDDAFRDPEGTGRRHADEMIANAEAKHGPIPLEQTVLLGINEWEFWRPNGPEMCTRYTVAFLDRLTERNYPGRGGALNAGVGWPADMGYKDSPVNWVPLEPVHQAIKRGGHYLVLHEYWDITGHGDGWRWWAGRYTQCPWDVPIIIGECGVDRYVRSDTYKGESRGWTIWLTQEAYMAQLAWYDNELRKDKRIVGATIYTWDFGKPWGVFDIRPLRDRIIEYVNSVPEQPPAPVTLEQRLQAEFGTLFVDLRATLPQHPSLRYASRPASAITQTVLHHTTGDPNTTTWAGIAQYHVTDRGCPGIGYHLGVEQSGKVVYLGDIETTRYHAGDANGHTVGIACLGDYWLAKPPPAMLDSVRRLRDLLGYPMIGHRDIDPTNICPGQYLYAALIGQPVTPVSVPWGIRDAAWIQVAGGLNPGAALFRYAELNGLGHPLAKEDNTLIDGVRYAFQAFDGGIAYCRDGDWGNVKAVTWL